jgi:hypothetical protein
MYLDYYAMHKIQDMQQEAKQRRLAQQVRDEAVADNLLAAGVELIGRQLIRLGAAISRPSHQEVLAIHRVAEPECCTV